MTQAIHGTLIPERLGAVVDDDLRVWFAWADQPRFQVIKVGVADGGDDGDFVSPGACPAARHLMAEIREHLRGNTAKLPINDLDLSGLSAFAWRVLTTLRETVPRGQVISYGELAVRSGEPRAAARAVARCLARNPFPLFFPCHRVILANDEIGGFMGDLRFAPLKARLLLRERPALARIHGKD